MAGRLTEDKIAEIARNVASSKMESIAIGFLKVDGDKVEALKDYHRGKSEPFNIDILREWRNQNGGGNEIQRLAVLLHQSATKGSYINPNKVEDILGVSKEQAVMLEKRQDQSPGAGTGTGPAPIPATPVGAAPAGQSDKDKKDKKLTTQMILKLSERLASKENLRKLALTGLEMEPHVFEKHVNNSREKFTEAAYDLLQEWMHSQRNHEEAYVNMEKAIETVKLYALLEVLEPTQ